jgi:PAS domain S-box-containing protein
MIKPGLLSRVAFGIMLIDPQTHLVVDINDTAVTILGIPREVILGHECTSSACMGIGYGCPFLSGVNIEGHPGRRQVEKADDVVPVLRSFSKIVIDGKPFIAECLIDITDGKDAEIELKYHEDLLRAVYENASVGMAILDMNGNFYQVNRALCEMLWYTEEELLSHKYTVTHPDDLVRSEHVLAQLKTGSIHKNIMEKRYVRKDGSIIYALHNVSLIRDNIGNPYLFIIQAQDITYLKESLQKAVEADNLKTTFLQNLSHEVRTPANAIIGFYELMKDPECNQEEKTEYIDLIRNGVEQFISILNNIVDISKIETSQLPVKKEIIDVNRFIREVYNKYSAKINMENHPGVEFSLYMMDIPNTVFIEGDEIRLKQALDFLLDNAFKFTRVGTVTLGCHINSQKEVLFFVTDTGIGIPPEKQEYIFNKFRQGDESGTRQFGGLGLGLTLARDFITLQGGKLWLKSEPDKGTSVYCSMPITGEKTRPKKGRADISSLGIIDLTGKSILIAEDTDSNYTVLERWLKKTNARIIRARNGLEAIEMCHHDDTINLVLMDLQMPVVNGYDATTEILGFRPGLPIIAQTAYSLDFDEHKAIEIGCVAYFSKPLDLSDLLAVIKKHLG